MIMIRRVVATESRSLATVILYTAEAEAEVVGVVYYEAFDVC